MFIEPTHNSGWIEVICGSMFSGKTEELLRRLKRGQIAQQRVVVFKPTLDIRYAREKVVSHDQNSMASVQVEHASEILDAVGDVDIVGIDEAQFFETALVDVCVSLAQRGKRVILAGLDTDFKGKPFGPMPQLLAVADYVNKLHAVCHVCGNLAMHTYRKSQEGDQVALGAHDLYEARCRTCFNQSL